MESRDTITEQIGLEWDVGNRDWPDPLQHWSLGIGDLHRELCIYLPLVGTGADEDWLSQSSPTSLHFLKGFIVLSIRQ